MPDPFGDQPVAERRDTRSREDLLAHVRREFTELAGLTLTLRQAMRLLNLDRSQCERLLGELVKCGELVCVGEDTYKRPPEQE